MSDYPDWMRRLDKAFARESVAGPREVYPQFEALAADVRLALDVIRNLQEQVEGERGTTRRRLNEIRQATSEMQQACVQAMKRWQIIEREPQL